MMIWISFAIAAQLATTTDAATLRMTGKFIDLFDRRGGYTVLQLLATITAIDAGNPTTSGSLPLLL